MEPTIALSLFKSILEINATIEEEDNNITDQNEVHPYVSNIMLQWVDKSSIAQTLKTIKMKQLIQKPMYLAQKPKCWFKW